jgi:hypothetical protein
MSYPTSVTGKLRDFYRSMTAEIVSKQRKIDSMHPYPMHMYELSGAKVPYDHPDTSV